MSNVFIVRRSAWMIYFVSIIIIYISKCVQIMSMKPRTMIKNIMDVVNCHKTLEPKTCVISVDASHSDFDLRQSAWMIYFVSIMSTLYFKEI